MSIFKSLISTIIPPQPIEVAPQIVEPLLNLHTDTAIFNKFMMVKKCRAVYPKAVEEAYGQPDTCSFERFEAITRGAILAFLWWYFEDLSHNKFFKVARAGIPIAADWSSHCSSDPIQRGWGRTNQYFEECKSFVETEIYHIPISDESYMRYHWLLIKDKPDLIDRQFGCTLNWYAQRLFTESVKSFRSLDYKIPFYHPLREYLYECVGFCERKIERGIEVAHY